MSVVAAEVERKAVTQTVERAKEDLQLSYSVIAAVLGVDRRTVQRWRNHENAPSPEHRERIEKLRELLYLLDRSFETRGAMLEWLHSPVPLLRGRSPMSFLHRGQIDPVLSVLAGLEAGAFI